MNLELRINELVLSDVFAADRHQIAATIERELTRLFREQGIPAALREGAAAAFAPDYAADFAPGTRPDRIGQQVAQSLYDSLGRERP